MFPSKQVAPCILVHGGAWKIPVGVTEATLRGVETAARTGYAVLAQGGGNAVDAVEAAVRVLEDDPVFDAGRGSCLNAERGVEMDAVIMADGCELPAAPGGSGRRAGMRLGAVAAVTSVRHPVTLARRVMEHTRHCLLVGRGADLFAEEVGAERVSSVEELITAEAADEWARYRRYESAVDHLFNTRAPPAVTVPGHDTVGAVALDARGGLAVATSTGGITSVRVGRVGDSPLVGCGAFCDAAVGAVSTTGHGEAIMKCTLARHAVWLMENGKPPAEAAKKALEHMLHKTGSCGGMIVVDKDGNLAHEFSTERMAWAQVDRHGKASSGIDHPKI